LKAFFFSKVHNIKIKGISAFFFSLVSYLPFLALLYFSIAWSDFKELRSCEIQVQMAILVQGL